MTIPRKPIYETSKAVNRVYLHDASTGKMVFRSAHTTYQLAQAEIVACLQAGYTDKAVLHHKYGVYTFTAGPMTYGKVHKALYRDGVRFI
jgi:hypothetical protein